MTSGASSQAFEPARQIARDLDLRRSEVEAVLRLLQEGSTIPFIARYRKEATGGLDEVKLRSIQEKFSRLTELDKRRRTVLGEIESQGKLTPELRAQLLACGSKTELEDLYLPYKPQRRTRANLARQRGLGPLAEIIWKQPRAGNPKREALAYVDPARGVADVDAALRGARDILAEQIAATPELRAQFRQVYRDRAEIRARKRKEFRNHSTKFDTYADFRGRVARLPSHQVLAIRRGESEKVLRVTLQLDVDRLVPDVERRTPLDRRSPYASELGLAIADGIHRLLIPAVESDTRAELKQSADEGAVTVFAQNLRELLLAAPFGAKPVLGIDPGQRTGCKCATVDETGKLLEHALINLVQGPAQLDRARETLRSLWSRHPPRAIAVGNGTHGRETEAFVRDLLRADGIGPDRMFCVSVSETGASVYSASEIARKEFPDLDLTVRGAISIARRLQDPLAELVKIEPQSLGVGQYQHDVSQALLGRKLDEVVESCVNQVGVELNTASAPLLARVAGIGPKLAQRIVAQRDTAGPFGNRRQLLKVPGLGPRAFEQCAGFLRVRDGDHPLDASAVHPERYALVERMAADLGVPVTLLIGSSELIGRIDQQRYCSGDVGTFTLNDILEELHKPGRDPRAAFDPPKFRDDVRTLEDLREGMELEGVVTNVAAFGAFVDVGVHQDGLVHVSQLSDRFVRDPHEVVKVGEKLRVTVLTVDLERRRISLRALRGR
jgi:uncharacterized protein